MPNRRILSRPIRMVSPSVIEGVPLIGSRESGAAPHRSSAATAASPQASSWIDFHLRAIRGIAFQSDSILSRDYKVPRRVIAAEFFTYPALVDLSDDEAQCRVEAPQRPADLLV